MKKELIPTHLYRLTQYMRLITTILVNGSPVSLNFDGGTYRPYKRNGSFSTADPDVIKAIESSGGYNLDFVRVSPKISPVTDIEQKPDTPQEDTPVNPPVIDTPEEETSAVIPQTLPVETATAAPETPAPAATQLTPVPGITSGQKARAYILSKYEEVKSTDLRTNAAIKAIAEEKGITFPDWIEQ